MPDSITNGTRRRRVRATGIGQLEVVTDHVPAPAAGEVLVRMLVAGVCGSDLHALAGHHRTLQPPYFPGHEVVGRVEAVGAGVERPAVGELVTPEPTLPCGDCKPCRAGNSNVCARLEFFGCGWREGGMADVFVVPAARLHLVPAAFSLQRAALIEPLATPVHALRLAGDVAGRTVAVIGCGTIGLLTLIALRHAGAGRVVMTDLREDKRAAALSWGADAVVDGRRDDVADQVVRELGEPADLVIDCVSVQSTVASAFSIVERGGTVITVGVPAGELMVPAFALQDRQLRLQGAATYLAGDFDTAIRILADPRYDALITNSFPLAEPAAAFAAAGSGAEIKVLLTGESGEQ